MYVSYLQLLGVKELSSVPSDASAYVSGHLNELVFNGIWSHRAVNAFEAGTR
jgi:hypothetical protein